MEVPIKLDMLMGSEVMVTVASPPCCWKKQELASNAKARQEGGQPFGQVSLHRS